MRRIGLIVLIAVLAAACSQPGMRTPLDQWQLDYQGRPIAATVPGCVHTDLMAAGIVADPYMGCNEEALQWISDSVWTYSTTIHRPKGKEHCDLVFEGLDTRAEVRLDGELIGSTDNMFRQWRYSLDSLNDSALLTVAFYPEPRYDSMQAAALGYAVPDPRAFSRTAPYQQGWDWGPKLNTCGIWQPAYLEQWEGIRLGGSTARTIETPKGAMAVVTTRLYSDKPQQATLRYKALDTPKEGNCRRAKCTHQLEEGWNTVADTVLRHTAYKTWTAVGSEGSSLYRLEVRATAGRTECADSIPLAFVADRFEIRPDSIGTAYMLTHSGETVWVRGANWIPVHSFPVLDSAQRARYHALLCAAKESGFNMLRVWGGGIYEPDYFYDLCDSLGIAVWQDFDYSCTFYPGDSAFIENARQEAEEQALRLAKHPCIAVWCGNNEVKNGWEDWGWQQQYGYTPAQQQQIEADMERLFGPEGILAQAVRRYSPQTPYAASSPLWGWGHEECCTHGDSHYWGVWWGEMPFEVYREKTGRFMSEYGFQSYPQMSTIAAFCPEEQRFIGSPAMSSHQKHGRGVAIIDQAMERYYGRSSKNTTLEEYAYLSQVLQAYGVGMGIEAHRLRSRELCFGTLYWQLNDCWPVASWSSIDYYGNWKALQYRVCDLFAPTAVLSEPDGARTAQIYVANDERHAWGTLKTQLCLMDGTAVDSQTYACGDFAQGTLSGPMVYMLPEGADPKRVYLKLEYASADNKSGARKVHYFVSPKALELPRAEVALTSRYADGRHTLTLHSPVLAKDVHITALPWCHGNYSDNFFDLLPGETVEVTFEGKENLTFEVRTLNNL